jgi:phosphate acetyltransferase
MSNSLYITATEARSGKTAICLGLMEMLLGKIDKVGFFRPIIDVDPTSNERDNDIHLITSHFGLTTPYENMYGYTTKEVGNMISLGKGSEALQGVMKKYDDLKEKCDFILCEGTDFDGSTAAFELDFNAVISRNLGSSVLLVARSHKTNVERTLRSIELALQSLHEKGCRPIATIVNRTAPENRERISEEIRRGKWTKDQLTYTIPEEEALTKFTVGEIAEALGAEVLFGETELNRHVYGFTVAAMQLQNFLPRISRGSLIITPGDRADIIAGCLAVVSSPSMENIAGILLTGGLKPEKHIWDLIRSFPQMVPILCVDKNTFPTAAILDKTHAIILPENERKISRAIALFEKNVNVGELAEKVVTTRTNTVTPMMFEFELIQKAKAKKQHIVLPEGEEERILRAAEILLQRDVADITLLGKAQIIRDRISALGLRLNDVNIVEPAISDFFENYIETYHELRKHKGITDENARDIMSDSTYFGTMMVYKGHADGMVSGSVHSTAVTVRPAFEIIKTKPGFSVVSSVFFMCLTDKVLVYGDCAVNPNPNAEQLAEIAISSAKTAQAFEVEPFVAFLSYSTGESGKGADVGKVHEATQIARKMAKESFPGLKIEGPIQYDAAVDPGVALTKLPESSVAGKATVFVFPDLNTGNNTYKAVQRSSGAVAIGPVLQGLRYPINDLSRGCTIPDIVNTVAITAIQAQSEKE